MNHYYIKVTFAGIIKKLVEDRTAGNGFHVGGFTFFTINISKLPVAVLA
jgi:hypothetical protein